MKKQRNQPHTPEAVARELLNVIVYDKCCRSGDAVETEALIEISEIGDWKVSRFETARSYAASQGWLVIEGNNLRLTTAGLAAA